MSGAAERNGGPAPGAGRVAVAMSGGVDSSVAAALLVEQGYDVVGVHMKLNDLPDDQRQGKSCCSLDDSLDARQVCAKLGIPFYIVDFIEPFRRWVMDDFVATYAAGQTPNPCVMCNRHVKHAALMTKVREFGCEFLATGHYARIRQNPETRAHEILKPRDRRKDQTYFLFGTPAEELPYLLFPLADYEKPAAREIAEGLKFVTWNKPDSQEVCFVPKDYRDFLRAGRVEARPGAFVDRDGRELGTHGGVAFYTVGQRRGLGLSSDRPLYVIALDARENRVVLGREEELYATEMAVRDVNWLSGAEPPNPIEAVVKIRYADAGTPARVAPSSGGGAAVTFARPVRAITPGQSAVFYEGDLLLGGGWIEERAG